MNSLFAACVVVLMVATGAACQTNPALKPVVARVVANAHRQTTITRSYDPAYVSLAYPGGDVPMDRGVCTDVVIRALRAGGVDLQKVVHEDMRRAFGSYPKRYGLRRPDRNIDHRRVPNLQTYFKRRGKAVPVTINVADFLPGDIVSWELPNGRDHIGVVSDVRVGKRPAVIHNIGQGTRQEDVLFTWKITGHYRPL